MPDGEVVQLRLRNFAQIPGGISLDNQGDSEAQLWGSFGWGLLEPVNWPLDSKLPGIGVFREIPMSVTMKLHNDWQSNSGVTAGESPASTTSSESTEMS